ncbi:MAG: 2-amino-4-hydroxy-6-hydroxymethyldihydropteridine diphosphokinase [Woeseiaceae bacterium]
MAERWRPAYVAIGSNLDDPLAHVRRAVFDLKHLSSDLGFRCSAAYRSAPLGPADQPEYINAVAGFLTRHPPQVLLAALQTIEAEHGRSRDGTRWGPRTLDLDLLAVGDFEIASETLSLPHPEIEHRSFVLKPWCDVTRCFSIPGLGVVSAQRNAACGDLQFAEALT